MNRRLLLPVFAIVIMIVAWIVIFGGGLFAPHDNVSVVITGDVMIGRNVQAISNYTDSPYNGVRNVTSAADLLLIDFENTASYSMNAVKHEEPLKCEPRFVHLAKGNNNTVAALANDHVCDYGIIGLRDTIEALDKNNITHLGAGEDEDHARQSVSQEINGKTITIFNYMDSALSANYTPDEIPAANGLAPGYAAYNAQIAHKQISEAKEKGDVVIVYMHYGEEFSKAPNDNQKKISHELIDSGADVVVGSNPHVPQGVEMYNGKPIFYSLGDFIFDIELEDALESYFVQIDFVGDTAECTVYPIHIKDYMPYFVDANTGNTILNSLNPNYGQMQIDNGVGKLQFNLTQNA